MPGIPSSIYTPFCCLGLYCTWYLLCSATSLQVVTGTFAVWKYGRGKASRSPLLNLLSPTCRAVPCPSHPASKGPEPHGFLNTAAETAWVDSGGLSALSGEKKSRNTVNFCQFCQMNSVRTVKNKLLGKDFAAR